MKITVKFTAGQIFSEWLH